MTKQLVNQKRGELKQLPRPEFIDRILNYPDWDSLNMDETGKNRPFPIGKMAEKIQENGYKMSDKQYYTLLHHFPQIAIQDLKVVGVTFRKNNAAEFEKELVSSDGPKSVFKATFTLRPEPENPYDENAVMVLINTASEGMHQIGYLSRDFVAKHRLTEDMEVSGTITDFSNGKFKNVSYALTVDTEKMQQLGQGMEAAPKGDETMDGYHGPERTRIYERVFSCNGTVPDPERATSYVNSLNLREQLNADFGTYGVPCHAEELSWSFHKDGTGSIRMELTGTKFDGPVTASSVANSFVKYQHDGPLASRMQEEGLVDVRLGQNVFNKTANGGFVSVERAAAKMADVKDKAASQIVKYGEEQKRHIEKMQRNVEKTQRDDLKLTEADLGFAGQMDLSQFGLY